MSTQLHCRLCAMKFPPYLLKNLVQLECEQLDVIIYKCLHIKINEKNNLPKTACVNCCNIIINFHDFSNKVAIAQKLLCDLFIESNSTTNTEPSDSTFYTVKSSKYLKNNNPQQWNSVENNDKNIECDESETKNSIFIGDTGISKSDSNIKSEPVYYGDDNRWLLENNENLDDRSINLKQESNFDTLSELTNEITGKSSERPLHAQNKENNKHIKNKLEHNEFSDNNSDDNEDNNESGNRSSDDTEDENSNPFDYFTIPKIQETPQRSNGKRKRSGIKNHICHKCGKSYLQKGHLASHILTHVEGLPYTCDKCGKAFKTKLYLNNHSKCHLPQEIKNTHECDICHKKYSTASILRRHKKIHEDTYDYTCEICGKCFHRKENLDDHKLIHTDIFPFHCEQCPGVFKSLSRLKKHQVIHTDYKPHICSVCGKEFREKRLLTQHQKIHSNELPYECEYCKKAFRKKEFLKVHLRQHTGERPYSCLECNHHFANSSNFMKHMKVRHGKITKNRKNNNGEIQSGQNILS